MASGDDIGKRHAEWLGVDEAGFPPQLASGPWLEDSAEPGDKWPHLSARHRWSGTAANRDPGCLGRRVACVTAVGATPGALVSTLGV